MSVLEWRGGFPAVFKGTVTTAGAVTGDDGEDIPAGTPIVLGKNLEKVQSDGRQGRILPKWIEVRNLTSTPTTDVIRVYFTQKHFDDDVHGLSLLPGNGQLSAWSAPAEVVTGIWLRAEMNTPAFTIIAISRRG